MQFTKRLRDRVRTGAITTSIRIWKHAHVKAGGRYRMPPGSIVVTAVNETGLDDVSDAMARDSGFANRVDLLKTAKHGNGERVFFIRFRYEAPDDAMRQS